MDTVMVGNHGPRQVGGLRQRPLGRRPARGGPCLLSSDLRPLRPGLVRQGDGGNGPLLEGGRLHGPRRAARDPVPPREPADLARRHPFQPQVTGDSWQNYASRWALCHFLINDPNYSPRFLALGRGILAGKDISFDQTYVATARELWFEYLLFLRHIDRGYRVDLCAWDWNKKFAYLRPGHAMTATVRAGHGWQPTGLTVSPGGKYDYAVTGNWRIASDVKATDVNGDDHGRGRLVGVLMKGYQLGPEFEVGGQGSLDLTAGGDLYLRCRNAWGDLANDSGRVSVRLKLQGGGK